MGTKTDKQDEILRAKREVLTEVRSKMSHWEDCLTGKITGYEMSARKWNALCKKYSLKEASVEVVEPPETSDTDQEIERLEQEIREKNKEIFCLEYEKDFLMREAIYIVKQIGDPKSYVSLDDYKELYGRFLELEQKCQGLGKSQNSKAIEVLEKLKKKFEPLDDTDIYLGYEVVEKIDNQITELRGGENE